ncbi:GNAT family N-acetyltransferase [Pelomonas sp. KK5]|uniref:GNAT family N-acetyltransferase n=1 Tax=Pelomonas sp. KK5 TaxID=1855730 RepID=UPI00097C2DA4|nr:GNAT family N-acetyltransferase [Pelomonas sp. KK5]
MDTTISAYARPQDLPADARRLLERAGARNLELGYDWFSNLVDTVYKDSPDLRFYVMRRAGTPVALLPVRVETVRFGQQVAALSNFYSALYEPAFDEGLDADALKPLLQAIRKDFPRAYSLWFSPMDPQSQAYKLLIGACRSSGWAAFEFFCFGNWFLRIEDAWTGYFQKRAGAVRSTVKRMSKKFAAAGGRLQIVRELADLPQAIAAYEHIYGRSWKKPEPHADFIPGLINTFGQAGQLLMGVAWLGEQAIASQLWLVGAGRAEIFKLAYDEEFKEFSPGTLLTTLLMEQVFEQVQEIDYLIGDDTYKSAWMAERRERWGFVAYRRASLAGSLAILRESATRLLKRLRATPAEKTAP